MSHALHVHARTLKQQKYFIRKSVRASETGVAAQFGDMVALRALVVLDNFAGRVILFGNFDRSIGEGATAIGGIGKDMTELLHPGLELFARIMRMRPSQLLPKPIGFRRHRPKILRDQPVFGFEVTVERHLVRIRHRGNFIDAHRANAAGIKQLSCSRENPFPGRQVCSPVAGMRGWNGFGP